MTDFIVYISAQQRVQAVVAESEPLERKRPSRVSLVAWCGFRNFRQRVSVVLYRLAEAIQPIGEPTSATVSVPR